MKRETLEMRKKILVGIMLAVSLVGLGGCGDNQQEDAEPVDYNISFTNETDKDVAVLKVRPTEDFDWSNIVLQDAIWSAGYEMNVNFNGVLPESPEGWQVEMTFDDGEVLVWKNIAVEDDKSMAFMLDDGGMPTVQVEDIQPEEADADTDANADDTVNED